MGFEIYCMSILSIFYHCAYLLLCLRLTSGHILLQIHLENPLIPRVPHTFSCHCVVNWTKLDNNELKWTGFH